MLLRERPRMSGALPLPAPLPSLTTALSRRAAIFGAVVAPMALAGSAAHATALPEVIRPDAESRDVEMLVRDAYIELHKLPLAGEPTRDDYIERAATTKAGELIAVLARTPATNRADLVWKAGFYTFSDQYDVDNVYDLGVSVARDVVRIDGGGR